MIRDAIVDQVAIAPCTDCAQARRPTQSSERELEAKLDLSCRTRAENFSEVGCEGESIGKIEVRGVEEIECLEAKLESLRFVQCESSYRSQIKILCVWSNHYVATAIAEGTECRRHKC